MAKAKLKSPLWELQNRENKVGICEMCNQRNELTIDHIFPASLLHKWGLIEEVSWDSDNLALICKTCQIMKKDSFNFHDKRTIPLIEKYINKIKQNK